MPSTLAVLHYHLTMFAVFCLCSRIFSSDRIYELKVMIIHVLPCSSVGHQHIECGQFWTSNNLSSLVVAFNFCELFFLLFFSNTLKYMKPCHSSFRKDSPVLWQYEGKHSYWKQQIVVCHDAFLAHVVTYLLMSFSNHTFFFFNFIFNDVFTIGTIYFDPR
jgi:hypothetical protein